MGGSWHILSSNTNSYKPQVYNIIIHGWKVAVFSRTVIENQSIGLLWLLLKYLQRVLQMGASHNVYKL